MVVLLFIATVLAANLAVAEFGVIPIGFGLSAPAGVYSAGLAFTLRDFVRERHGRNGVIIAIAGGVFLSALLEDVQRIALASAVAFALSESADALVYEPLRKRGWARAVVVSNLVGLTLDSVLFLSIAFGSLDFLAGQIVAKSYMTALAVAGLWVVRTPSLLCLAGIHRSDDWRYCDVCGDVMQT